MRRRLMKHLKRFGACFLSFTLILLMAPGLGTEPESSRANAAVVRGPWENQKAKGKREKAKMATGSGQRATDRGPLTTDKIPVRVTWDLQGRIQDGKLRVNQAWMDIRSFEVDGVPSSGTLSPTGKRLLQRPPHLVPLSTSGGGPGERRGLETARTSFRADAKPIGVLAALRSPTRRLSAGAVAATEPKSIEVMVSPTKALPGSQVTVSGKLPPGSQIPIVRVLFRVCDFTRGMAEAPVGSDGRFRVDITIPEDALVGPSEVIVAGGAGDQTVSGRAPFSVLSCPLAGSVSGVVLVEQPNGTTKPAQGATSLLLTPNPKHFQSDPSDPAPPFFVFHAPTDNKGKFLYKPVDPGNYILTANPKDQGAVVEWKLIEVKCGEHLTVNILGKIIPTLKPCVAWKQMNPGKSPPLVALTHKPGPAAGPHIGTFASMPGKGKPLMNTFKAILPFSTEGAQVRFRFGNVKTVAAQPKAELYLDSWGATVDMSEFPPGEYKVSIEVLDPKQPSVPACTLDTNLSFTMIDVPWFNSGWIQQSKVEIKSNPVRYEFTGLLPKPAFNFNKPLNLEFATLDNIVTFGIPIKETLYLDGTWTGQATATAKITFLDFNLLNKMASYTPSGGQYQSRPYAFKLPTLHSSLVDETIKIFAVGCCIPEVAWIGVSLSLHIAAFIEVDSTIKKDLKVNVIISPGGTFGLTFTAEIDALLCDGDAGVEPQLTMKLPIYYDLNCSPPFGFDDPCFSVDAVFFYKVVCFWIFKSSGSKTKHIYEFGCDPPNTCNPGQQLMAGSESKTWLPGPAWPDLSDQRSASSQNPEAPLSPKPSVASDGAGHALAVWLDDPSPEVLTDRQFYYSYYDGTRWSPPQRLNSEEALVDHARIAFLGPNRALAVWMQSKLTHEQAHEADVSTLMRNGELYYALWDGRTWSESAPITNDNMIDAKPSLASDPSTGRAMLVWMRTDQFVSFDSPPLTEIYYASFDGRQWSQPAHLAPRGRAIDYQPSVQFDRRGQAVAVWLRDVDGNLMTREDRQILMSRFDGRAWSAPEAIPNLPAGAYSPSFAFDKDNNPIVVFVVPPLADPNTGQLGTGDGNSSELYAAYRRGATWEVTGVGQDTFVERPVVKVNPDNRAIILYRQFGTFGVHQSGDLAVGVADLNAPRLQWRTGFLTADGLTNWQVAFDIDQATSKNFVLNVKKTPGRTAEARSKVAEALATLPEGERIGGNVSLQTLGGHTASVDALAQNEPAIAVVSYVVPYAVDLALTPEDIAFSNTHALVGETVTITAAVRNAGLKATSDRTPFSVKFYDGDPARGGTLIGEQQVEQALLFNTTASVSVPYTVSRPGVQTITVVVDEGNAVAESDETNNKVQVTFGRTPAPVQLFVNPDHEKKVMSLGWTAPETEGIDYYLIFRSTMPGGPYEFVGDTTMTDFIDTLVTAGVTYYYVVVAVDIYGTRSEFSNEASGKLSQ